MCVHETPSQNGDAAGAHALVLLLRHGLGNVDSTVSLMSIHAILHWAVLFLRCAAVFFPDMPRFNKDCVYCGLAFERMLCQRRDEQTKCSPIICKMTYLMVRVCCASQTMPFLHARKMGVP